jgi:hypothetical protein
MIMSAGFEGNPKKSRTGGGRKPISQVRKEERQA